MLAQYLDAVQSFAQANLPITIGGVVAVFVLTYLFWTNRRRRREVLDAAALTTNVGSGTKSEKALNWAPPEQSYADRRGTVRREGAPVRVLLSSPSFRNGVNDGYVVDRSTGGLRILMNAAMVPGSNLQVRALNAPDTIGFVTVIVRSCKKEDDHFVLGTEFDKTPPWNVLLLFG
jgi:hypothetical protein